MELFQVFLLSGFLGKVFGFFGICFVVVEFACLDGALLPIAPFDVAVSLSARGVSHEVAVLAMAIALEGTRVLAKGGGFPWTVWFLQKRQQVLEVVDFLFA